MPAPQPIPHWLAPAVVEMVGKERFAEAYEAAVEAEIADALDDVRARGAITDGRLDAIERIQSGS